MLKKLMTLLMVLMFLTGCMTLHADEPEDSGGELLFTETDEEDNTPFVYNNQNDYSDDNTIVDHQEEPSSNEEIQDDDSSLDTDVVPDNTKQDLTDIFQVEFLENEIIRADDTVYVFDESVEIDGVVINVSAEEGVFPANSILSVVKVELKDEENIFEEDIPQLNTISEKPTDEESIEDTITEDLVEEQTENVEESLIEDSSEESTQLEEVLNREIDNETVQQIEAAVDDVRDEEKKVAVSYTYDIKVLDKDGNELQPNGKVSVKFSLAEKMQDVLDVDVYHIDDEMNVDVLDSNISKNEEVEELNTDVVVETESFSYYTVEFTYGNLQYVMDGDTTVLLSDILDYLGITGEVDSVEVSDDNLFYAYQEDGIWYVHANHAFTSEEWMKVTIDDIEFEYDIIVTDATTVNITLNANGGTLSTGGTTKTVSATISGSTTTYYSHTENIDDTGLKSSDYGNNWTNSNIRGSGRTSASSDAHVITISGASSLTVDLYFNGESTSYDWVSVWAGNYPSYTASDYNSTGKVTTAMGAPNNTNKYGGKSMSGVTFGTYTVNGNTLTNMGHIQLTIPNNSVTFAFKSDSSGAGGTGYGYGYYAIVKETPSATWTTDFTGTVSRSGYIFKGWNTNSSGTGTHYDDFHNCLTSTTLYAEWETPAVFPSGTFYIEAIENTTIALTKVGSPTVGTAKYSVGTLNNGVTYDYGTPINLIAGQKCYFTITSTTFNFTSSNYLKFTSTGKINVGGNLSSLIGGQTSLPRNYCFYGLFENCTTLINASALNFGSITNFNSNTYVFYSMFSGCTSLTTAPALPVTTLSKFCYYYMFYGCTSLTAAPALPATTLANYCYSYMFSGCTSLTTAPALPATTLADYCYQGMFHGCTSLATAPALPATTLSIYCYQSMFYGTSLTTAPALPATTLVSYCYQNMFSGCTSLTTAPALPATTLADNCYKSMFWGCTSLTTAPALPATTLAGSCYESMFRSCTSLTVPPALPALTLAKNCYSSMFRGCTKIKLSQNKTGQYQIPYRIPSGDATGTGEIKTMDYMFSETGGTFTGTPSINTTYYLPAPMSYTLTIPTSINRNTTSTLDIGYEISGGNVAISVSSANSWKFKNGSSVINYNLSKTSWTINEGTGTDSVNINVTGVPTAKGAHTDTLTFTYGEAS